MEAAAGHIVLIPAYQPGRHLIDLLTALRDHASPCHATAVVVVDDGSGEAYQPVFVAAAAVAGNVVLLRHDINHGKGAALRTGFSYIAQHYPGYDVVCADSDGQHSAQDILRVARRVAATRTTVLGVRAFTGEVPLRSRLGNSLTRWLVKSVTGLSLQDTQTGLRGYPADLVGWLLTVGGDRYEYETALLIAASRQGHRIEQLEIATIYLDANTASHFRPVRDSARIYAPLLGFAATSLLSFVIDTVVLLGIVALTGALLPAVLIARAVSSSGNFLANRYLVFRRSQRTLRGSAWRYWLLAATILAANYSVLASLTSAGMPLLAAKVFTEAALFVTSYLVQRHVVFPSAGGWPGDGRVDLSAAHDGTRPLAIHSHDIARTR